MWSSQSMFHLPLERIQLTAPDVGGGFGMKNFLSPEWVLVLWAARRLGRPVKWVAERIEEFVAGTQGRDNHTRARLALDEDSRFLGLDVSTVANLGAYLSSNGPGSSTNSPATAMGGVYAIPAIFMDVRGTFTNTVPIDAYRGSGWGRPGYRSGALRAHRLRPRLGSVAERFADGLHAAPSRRSAPLTSPSPSCQLPPIRLASKARVRPAASRRRRPSSTQSSTRSRHSASNISTCRPLLSGSGGIRGVRR